MWKNKYTWTIVECGRIYIFFLKCGMWKNKYTQTHVECGRILNILPRMWNVEEYIYSSTFRIPCFHNISTSDILHFCKCGRINVYILPQMWNVEE